MALRLRNMKAEIVGGETDAELQTALNAFFGQDDEREFVAAFMIAAFTLLVLYAE
jgi:hypothetical protein